MEIYQARTSDLPHIQDMIRALSAYHDDQAHAPLLWLQQVFFGAEQRTTAYLAQRKGDVAGYAGVVRFPSLHEGVDRMDIQHLYVTEPHRHTGVGRALVAHVRQEAMRHQAQRLTIGTDPANRSAQAAYRAMGLQEITGTGPRFSIPLQT